MEKIFQCTTVDSVLKAKHLRFVKRVNFKDAERKWEFFETNEAIPEEVVSAGFVHTIEQLTDDELPVSLDSLYPCGGPIFYRSYINSPRDFHKRPRASVEDIYEGLASQIRGEFKDADYFIISSVQGDSYLVTFFLFPMKTRKQLPEVPDGLSKGPYMFDYDSKMFRQSVMLASGTDDYPILRAFVPDLGANFYPLKEGQAINPEALFLKEKPKLYMYGYGPGADREASHRHHCITLLDDIAKSAADVTVIGIREDFGWDTLPAGYFGLMANGK